MPDRVAPEDEDDRRAAEREVRVLVALLHHIALPPQVHDRADLFFSGVSEHADGERRGPRSMRRYL